MNPTPSDFAALYRYSKGLATALGYRDLMTRLHSERVKGLSAEIGAAYGLDAAALDALRTASSFHDIGKIGTPDNVLLKPAKLNAEEWKQMRQHAEIGEKILLSTGVEGAEVAAQAVRHHHEYFDGSGYPDGLSGEDIPIFSRMISIADSYDAMAVTRPYHKARSHSEVMEILLKESGHKHDPALMALFVKIIEKSPFKTLDA